MLLKCSPLYVLSMLQLVVLSGIVAAYSNSYHQSPPPRTTTESTTTSRTGNGRAVSKDIKSDVILKPVSLSYLRDNLEKVTSLVDFVRLFTIPGTADHHISHLIRTIRSASYPNMNSPRHNDDSDADFSGTVENNGENDVVNDDFISFDTRNAMENGKDESASKAKDSGNIYYDYEDPEEDPEEELSADDLEAFEAALHNMENTKTNPAYKCQHPTPFVHRVQDPHDDSHIFIPECVILHRCMNYSGCCDNSDLVCAAKSMNIIVESFLVVNRLSHHDDVVMYDAHIAKTLSFVNHTECECRQRPKPPKCTQECPAMFHLIQEQADCICDCVSLAGADLWKCEIVRDGVEPLPADGLECVRNGTCYQPRCAEGEFNVSSGYCPLTDKYALPSFMFENPADRHDFREHLRNLTIPNLHGKIASIVKGPILSPTPTSNNDGVFQSSTDEHTDIEHVLFGETSVHNTQTLPEFSQSSHESFPESSVFSTTEGGVSSQKSANEPPSSVNHSCDDDDDDDDDDEDDDEDDDMDDYDDCDDDLCGDLSTSEFAEGQSVLDSTSEVKGIQTGPAQKTVGEVVGDVTIVRSKDTNIERHTSPHLPSDNDLLLPVGHRRDVGSVKDDINDDHNDDDDDNEYTGNGDSSNSDYKDSSYKDYQTDSSSTDYYTDSQDVSSTNYFTDSLLTDYHTDSSFDPPRNDLHEDSSNKNHHKELSTDDHHEDPSSENHDKDSSTKGQTQEKRRSAPRHKFQTNSQFDDTVHSSETTDGQTGRQNINSEYRLLTPLSTVSSIAPSDSSLPSANLAKKSASQQASSSLSQASSSSSMLSSASPPSRLSSLFSLTMKPEAHNLETSTGTWLTSNQDPKTSTEKSFMRRFYKHRDASRDGSDGEGG